MASRRDVVQWLTTASVGFAIPLLTTIDAHPGAIYSLAIHPTGHTLASGGSDGTVRSWTCNP